MLLPLRVLLVKVSIIEGSVPLAGDVGVPEQDRVQTLGVAERRLDRTAETPLAPVAHGAREASHVDMLQHEGRQHRLVVRAFWEALRFVPPEVLAVVSSQL